MSRFHHSRAERLVRLTAILLLVHHVDHALRSIHSGWPLRPEVTEFTYSLLLYPVIAVLLWVRVPRLRIGLSAAVAVYLTAHALFEPYAELWLVWSARPEWNWLAASSPVIAALSVAVTIATALSAVAAAVAFVRSRGV